jgi:hypothetical protein
MSDTLRVSNLHFGLNTSNYNQPQLGFTSVGIGSTANYGFLQFFGTSNTLCWTANGTVGIGTTNPQYSLDVSGTTQLRGIIFGQPDVNPLPASAYTTLAQQWNVVSGLSSSSNWYGCEVSATGQYQTAIINGANSGNNIYYSSNYGATWSLATGFLANAAYIWMGMSGTGQYQLTSINTASTALYVSSNYGQTWSATSYTIGAGAAGRSSCISYDGQYQFNVQGGGSIAVSSNYGASFANAAVSTGSWNGVCCSSSGQYVTACIYGGNIFYSTNYGVAWTACTGLSNANWSQMCCSASGQYQMVTVQSGSIWYSSNYGVNWTVSNAPTSAGWQSISCTSSGQYVIAPIASGNVYYSTNYGVTWAILSSSPSVAWQACAISQNGVYSLACVNGGAVYSSLLANIAMVANGMVGIGTTNPQYSLDVLGTTQFNGIIPASGQPDSIVLPSSAYTTFVQQWDIVGGLSTSSVAWNGCGISATGQYQTAFVNGANSGNNIYYSSNYGTTWALATGFLANANYYQGAVSGSGQYQLVGISNPSSALYVSSNYGQTWSATSYTISGTSYGRCSCLSNNGQYQFNVQAGSGGGRIAVSSNYGVTFANSSAPSGEWHGVCCSSTGSLIFPTFLYLGTFPRTLLPSRRGHCFSTSGGLSCDARVRGSDAHDHQSAIGFCRPSLS